MAFTEQPTHLAPSELGTKEYWESCYEREIKNNQDDPDDEGTIWFEDSGAEERMIQLLEDLDPRPASASNVDSLSESPDVRIMDLGTGNGHMLFSLGEDGWAAQMVGVDYSQKSVELARRLQRQKDEEGQAVQNLRFEQWDMLSEDAGSWRGDGFDLVLDKGTFDAISLSDQAVDNTGLKGCELYPRKIRSLFRPGGYFVITSCNWTEEELRQWFEGDALEFHSRATYPSFTFGGQRGSTVSTLCFRYKLDT